MPADSGHMLADVSQPWPSASAERGIAFALGVLALAGSVLPAGVRVLLLSVAVVDDLLAITLIAIVFTAGLSPAWLAGGAAAGLYWLMFRHRLDREHRLHPISAGIALPVSRWRRLRYPAGDGGRRE